MPALNAVTCRRPPLSVSLLPIWQPLETIWCSWALTDAGMTELFSARTRWQEVLERSLWIMALLQARIFFTSQAIPFLRMVSRKVLFGWFPIFKVNSPSTSLWGDNSNSTVLLGTPYSASNYGTVFTASQFGNNTFKGYAPELIVFGRMLTPQERKQVESFLAVKYGITLKGSYLDSEGNLLWDIAENEAYHHRVTAFGTDAAGSLIQPLSTTSYEESHMYSALKDNGTYYDSNPYNLSSASRLLVMGREAGNAMPDKGYTFWGDDNASLATYTSPTDSLWHALKRTWMIKTNVPSSPDSTMTRLIGQGLKCSRTALSTT